VVSAAPSLPEHLAKARGTAGRRRRGDRDVRGSIAKAPWEDNAHARNEGGDPAPLLEAKRLASLPIRRSGLGRRETLGPPVKPRRAQTLRGAHAVKAAEANAGNMRGAGARNFRFGWQKSIGRIARLARREVKSLVADAQASRALARRKLEAPPDAGHGPREGETVRGTSAFIQTFAHGPASGFRLARSRDDRRRLRAIARVALTGSAKRESFGSQVNRSGDPRGSNTGSASDGKEAGSGVPESDHEDVRGRRDSVKAARGPIKPKGCPHPRR